MTTATAMLTEFLLARIAEDEAAALERGIVDIAPFRGGCRGVGCLRRADQPHALGCPARALARCEAGRRIVKLHAQEATDDPPGGGVGCVVCDETNHGDGGRYSSGWPCDTLRALVAVYADHEDFRAEWR